MGTHPIFESDFDCLTEKKMAGQVTLTSQDGQEIAVEINVIKQSKIVWQMLQDLRPEGDEEQIDALPIPNVNYAILKKVIDWCTKHKDDAPEEENFNEKKNSDSTIPKWDSEFLKVDQGTLFEIILAANYLDVPKLLDYACITVAEQIRGKSPEEIRKHFNIKNDFTEEEMERIKKENEWCEGI